MLRSNPMVKLLTGRQKPAYHFRELTLDHIKFLYSFPKTGFRGHQQS